MYRRFLRTTAVVLLLGSLVVLLLHVLNDPDRAGQGAITESEIAELARKHLALVDQIQIGGGYVWAKYDGHLHRNRLPSLR